MQQLYEYMSRQLAVVKTEFHRYLYDDLNWDNKMFGLVGPRGVGKTTLFLQRIKESSCSNDSLYVSADHFYFASHTLFDVAERFYKDSGKFLYIDEVHKYPNWSSELKMMYDSLPGLHVYFTGSSVLDIEKGNADLSRRAPKYEMQGLSFREFLAIRHGIRVPAIDIESIVSNRVALSEVEHPLPLFKEYLRNGYYPFGTDVDFDIELAQVIERTLEVDIPQFAGMAASTGAKLKRLLSVVSTLAPFKPNMSDLGKRIQASRNNVEDYLMFIEKAGMISQLRTSAGGLGSLGKVEKVYLDNTNILFNLSDGNEDIGSVRETFFMNQMRVKNRVMASKESDFRIGDMTFEVGGRGKTGSQLKGVERGFIVKDDIEFGYGNIVPLWAFGLNY